MGGRCDECGFDYDSVPADELASRLRGFGPLYRDTLVGVADGVARRRPAPAVWSPLEYACHVRDVFIVQESRVRLALAEDEPAFTPMGRDELVVTENYNGQDPAVVLDQLVAAADALAWTYGALSAAERARTGIYNYPVRQPRTLEWVARNTVHEGVHHLLDIRRGL